MMEQLSDRELLTLLKIDDHKAFAELTQRYWQDLFKHICSKIRNAEDARDIVQEIFLSCWKNRSNIYCDDQDRLSSYLFKAAKYAVINYFSRPGITISGMETLEQMLEYPTTAKSDEKILLKELHSVVDAELSELPDRLVVPYRLSREQHMSIKEIAAYLSVSEQTVKNNISAVLQRIRFRVGQYNSDPTVILIIALLAVMHQHDCLELHMIHI